MTAHHIRKKMEEMNDFILDVESKIRDGVMIDLSGFDREVTTLCAQAVKLPAEEARDIQPLMAELIGNLERLGLALKEFREGLDG